MSGAGSACIRILSLRRPLLVVGLLSATCWFVVRRGCYAQKISPSMAEALLRGDSTS
jgi:hypothetical protein